MTTPEQILEGFKIELLANQDDIFLIDRYAEELRSWASEVIGEDEYTTNVKHFTPTNLALSARDGLRKEQRQRAGIGEK